MADTITVAAHPDLAEGQVALWERDPEHPGGEVYVVAGGDECRVAETPAVAEAIANKRLVRADGRPARREDQSAPTEPERARPARG